jgi:hypothetical protein
MGFIGGSGGIGSLFVSALSRSERVAGLEDFTAGTGGKPGSGGMAQSAGGGGPFLTGVSSPAVTDAENAHRQARASTAISAPPRPQAMRPRLVRHRFNIGTPP